MIIQLPWPDRRLSPNARTHWRVSTGPKQSARIGAGWATIAAAGLHETRVALGSHDGPIPIVVRFYPPDGRRRDIDNMLASLKSALDGVADALMVDDNRFRPTLALAEPEKPGKVIVEIGA